MASSARPGRFLPGDPRVEEPYRLTPQLAFRVAILAFLALTVFAVLFLRLWALQVLSGDKYLAVANDNRVRTLRLEAPRGPMLDRNGRVLVEQRAGTRVELWPADLPKTWPAQRRELQALADRHRRPAQGDARPAEQARARPADADRRAARPAAGPDLLPPRARRAVPRRAPRAQLAAQYPYQSLAAQVLGYVGQITAGEYKTMKKKGYQPTDSIGQAGIESTYDTYLRGKDGKAQLTVDSRGRPKGASTLLANPTPGQALRLTIDIGLQRAAERALVYGIQLAHRLRATRTRTAARSSRWTRRTARSSRWRPTRPTSRRSSSAARTRRSSRRCSTRRPPTRRTIPGINRAIDAAYPPGSTFKPVTALAAMQEHLVTPSEQLALHARLHGLQADVQATGRT